MSDFLKKEFANMREAIKLQHDIGAAKFSAARNELQDELRSARTQKSEQLEMDKAKAVSSLRAKANEAQGLAGKTKSSKKK